MTKIRAGSLPASSLRELPLSSLCAGYLGGFCRRGDNCLKVHEICMVAGLAHQDRSNSAYLNGPINFLSKKPRLVSADKCVFDDDGPGDLSSKGVRHDNDHLDIRDISILPTMDEILCRRLPYMPQKDHHTPHRYVPGQQRLTDVNFRQLRYDSTEVIIDVCYHACQLSTTFASQPQASAYDDRVQTPLGLQYYLYRDINIESVSFHENQGIHVRTSFSCPEALRSRRIISSGRLERGLLVALIGYDKVSETLSTTFMNVDICQSTDAMKPITGNHSRGLWFPSFLLGCRLTSRSFRSPFLCGSR